MACDAAVPLAVEPETSIIRRDCRLVVGTLRPTLSHRTNTMFRRVVLLLYFIVQTAMILPRLWPKCRKQMIFSANLRRRRRPPQSLRSACAVCAGPTPLVTRCPRAGRLPVVLLDAVERQCYRPLLWPGTQCSAAYASFAATPPVPAVGPFRSSTC